MVLFYLALSAHAVLPFQTEWHWASQGILRLIKYCGEQYINPQNLFQKCTEGHVLQFLHLIPVVECVTKTQFEFIFEFNCTKKMISLVVIEEQGLCVCKEKLSKWNVSCSCTVVNSKIMYKNKFVLIKRTVFALNFATEIKFLGKR